MRRKDSLVDDKEAIIPILNKADTCRIAFTVDNIPYIVCLNYGYEWENELPVFYFHCASEGKKLDLMQVNNYVCFQLDTDHELFYIHEKVYCTMNYSSVVGIGYLELVENDSERIKGLNLLMEHHNRPISEKYPESSFRRTTVLKLKVSELLTKKKE